MIFLSRPFVSRPCGEESEEGEIKRASTAVAKPSVAGNAACDAGTISCSAAPARPPLGKWESSAVRPKGSRTGAFPDKPLSRPSHWRNAAKAALRFGGRAGDCEGNAVGPTI